MIEKCQNVIGLDLSKTTLKAVCLDNDKNILSYGITDLGIGSGDTEIILALKAMVGEKCPGCSLAVGLRGLEVFTRIFKVKIGSYEEVEKQVEEQLSNVLPVDRDEVEVSWEVLEKESETVTLLVIVVPNKVIERYQRLIKGAGLQLEGAEINPLSLKRAFAIDQEKTMLVDIHGDEMDIEFLDKEKLLLDKTLPIGGKVFTRNISKKMGITIEEAEKLKRSWGKDISDEMFESAYKVSAHDFIMQIGKIISMLEIENNIQPERILFSGGDLVIEKLFNFMKENLENVAECSLVSPKNMIKDDNFFISQADRYRLATAYGLAMKYIEKK